jgi:hypothetical protein
MLTTYCAVLKGDRLEWIDDRPESEERILKVYVTVLEELPDSERTYRGQKMAEALAKLAEIGAVNSIGDPVAWQREMRRDRELFEGIE